MGIGPSDPEINPFFHAPLPTLSSALDGVLPSLTRPALEGPRARSFPIDACLGVEGLPQSGTGQIALMTGRNAPELFGRHFGPWPPTRLRALLGEESFLQRARLAGHRVTFANAYPEDYPGTRDTRRVAAIPLAAHVAGVLTRGPEELREGRAVASEIVNGGWIEHLGHTELPTVTEHEAGMNLARIAGSADLTLFAHYHTDVAGHRGGMGGSVRALGAFDAFLAGVLEGLASDTLLLVVSDHGNIEDVRGDHTRNPALGLVLGAAFASFDPPAALTDIAGAVLSRLEGG